LVAYSDSLADEGVFAPGVFIVVIVELGHITSLETS